MNFVLKETPLGPHDVSLLAWCLSYRESTKRSKERQGPHSVILIFIIGGWVWGAIFDSYVSVT